MPGLKKRGTRRIWRVSKNNPEVERRSNPICCCRFGSVVVQVRCRQLAAGHLADTDNFSRSAVRVKKGLNCF